MHYLLMLSLLLLSGCNVDYEAMAKHRVEYAKTNQGDIVIAVIQDSVNSNYTNGINLAVEEINKNRGGLLGRPLHLQIEQSSKDFESTKPVIRRIISNPKISAVMGHRDARIAIPASIIYEKGQVIFLSPFVTSEALTSHNFAYTFRMLPNDTYTAKQISKISKSLGYNNIAILNDTSKTHRDFKLLFKKESVSSGLNLIFNRSFFNNELDFRSLLSDLKKENFDVILISSEVDTAIRLIRQIREMGINTPILSSRNLNSKKFTSSVGTAGNKIITPILYDELSTNKFNLRFKSIYLNKYNKQPDTDAALGYDSIMMFAKKVERAQTTNPAILASTIHFSPPWTGVTGTHYFDKKGDMLGKNYLFQVLNDMKWHKLPATYLGISP